MVVGYGTEAMLDPSFGPFPLRWRAGLEIRVGDETSRVVAALDSDPVVREIARVRWCHLSRCQFPGAVQVDGCRYSLFFRSTEYAGLTVNVDFLSSLSRGSVTRMLQAACEVAARVATNSEDDMFREWAAHYFQKPWVDPNRPVLSTERLRSYAGRILKRTADPASASEFEIYKAASELWYGGIDDISFSELFPECPPELAARLIPHLRLIREDDEA
jgi:hypothetical protein